MTQAVHDTFTKEWMKQMLSDYGNIAKFWSNPLPLKPFVTPSPKVPGDAPK
jgi:hypothetical protein